MTISPIAGAMRALSMVAALGCGSALAQTAAPATAPTTTLNVPNLAPSHVAVAIEVVKRSGMSRSIDLIVPQMIGQARQLFTQMRPELVGEIEKSLKNLQPDFEDQNNIALRIAGEAFAQKLSEPELKEIETFFKSTVGQKFVSIQPVLFSEMMRSLDMFTGKLSQTVVDKVREDLKKRGIQF